MFDLQVKIIEPVLKNNAIVTLNKSNILEFNLVLPPTKKEELTIKYSIEHQANDELEFF